MKKILLLNIGMILSVFSLLCEAQTRLYITTGFTSPVSAFYNKVLEEADKRLPDVSISFEVLPAERSLALLEQGINDGECCRIVAVVMRDYENIIATDESFFKARFSAFAKKGAAPITTFEALKPYSVGTVEGWKIAVNKIKAVEPAEVHIVTTPEQMFQMIDQGRLIYGVIGYLSGLQSIAKLNLNNIQAIEPPLIEKELYLMLHKKHQKYVPVFNKVFKEMKDDGTVDRLYSELIKTL